MVFLSFQNFNGLAQKKNNLFFYCRDDQIKQIKKEGKKTSLLRFNFVIVKIESNYSIDYANYNIAMQR